MFKTSLSPFLIVVMALFVWACASSKSNTYHETSMGVEIPTKTQGSTHIEVNETPKATEIGPFADGFDTKDRSKVITHEPVIALHIPNSADIFKKGLRLIRQLQRQGIRPRVYSGVGEGAILATLLAFNLTPDEIEWRLFALERDNSKNVLSLLDEFQAKNIEQSFHVLALSNGKRWLKRGNLLEIVNHQMNQQEKIYSVPSKSWLNADLLFVMDEKNQQEQIHSFISEVTAWKEARLSPAAGKKE